MSASKSLRAQKKTRGRCHTARPLHGLRENRSNVLSWQLGLTQGRATSNGTQPRRKSGHSHILHTQRERDGAESRLTTAITGAARIAMKLTSVGRIVAEQKDVFVSDGVGGREVNTRDAAWHDAKRPGLGRARLPYSRCFRRDDVRLTRSFLDARRDKVLLDRLTSLGCLGRVLNRLTVIPPRRHIWRH